MKIFFIPKSKKGFSLIEILIVITIIGILSAISVPAYLTYRNKAKVAQSLSFAHTIKTKIAIMMDNGTSPSSINVANGGNLSNETLPLEFSIDAGSIIITNAGGVANANLDFELQDQGNGRYLWICKPGIGANTTYLPSSCQSP